MPKYFNIRWKDKDIKELKRVIKNFNSKIDYTIKRNPYMSDILPSKVKYKDIRKNIQTRKDLEFELSRLKAFSKKNALDIVDVEGGARVIKWEYQQAKRMLNRINRRKQQARTEANVSTEKGTMGSIIKNNLQDKQFAGKQGQKSWDKFLESLKKQYSDAYWSDADENYKRNYMHALDVCLGSGKSIYYQKIKELIESLSAVDMIQAQYDNPILTIDFLYPISDSIRLDYEIGYPVYNAWIFWITQNNKYKAIYKKWKKQPQPDSKDYDKWEQTYYEYYTEAFDNADLDDYFDDGS